MSARSTLGWAGAGAALLVTFFGCYTGPHVELADRTAPDLQASTTHSAEAGPLPEGVASGLPCDVEALLAARCTSCHSRAPTTAPMALVTHADLTAMSVSEPGMTVAQLALRRIRDASKPMPPANLLPETDVAAFASWVDAGTPALGCLPEDVVPISHDAARPECVLASDCPGELICRGGTCDVECVKDKDCLATWTCKSTRCQPPATGGSSTVDGGATDTTTFKDFSSATSWSMAAVGAGGSGSYSGTSFDGRYVYFAPDGTNGKVLRFDTDQAFGNAAAWSVFDLTTLDPRATGYRGAAFDGRYLYLVPALGPGLLAARFDTQAPFANGSSWALFSVNDLGTTVAGFTGASFDGRYVYLVPAFGTAGITARFDTKGAFTARASWSTFSIATIHPQAISFAGAVFDGRFVYLVPWRSGNTGGGVIVRYDPQGGFSDPASWVTFDLTKQNANAKGYRSAVFDGRFMYLVPGWTAPTPSWASTTLARFDTQADFVAATSWTFFDMTALGSEAGGFNAAVFDGRYLVFAPGFGAGGYRAQAFRFDTRKPLAQVSSWSHFDTSDLSTSLVNLRGAAFDGRYVYLAPGGGTAARFDARTPRSMPLLPAFHGSSY